MKRLLLFALVLSVSGIGFAQTSEPKLESQSPSVANYSIMLVAPAGGGSVVIMHNPQNMLELVDVTKIQAAITNGYVPVRSVELAELISSFKEEIARLTAENKRLAEQPKQASSSPSLLSLQDHEDRQQAQVAAEQTARRAQIIQAWGMMQAMQPGPYRMPMPTPMRGASTSNRTQTNCTTQYVGSTAYTNCN